MNPHTPPPSIRRATADDAVAIALRATELARSTEGVRLEPARVLAGVSAALSRPETPAWVATVDDASGLPSVVGQVLTSAEWSDWNNGWYWWMQSVWVDPAHRRRGLLRRLMEEVSNEAAARAVLAVRLCVDRGNRDAIAAYGSLGFVRSSYAVMERPTG